MSVSFGVVVARRGKLNAPVIDELPSVPTPPVTLEKVSLSFVDRISDGHNVLLSFDATIGPHETLKNLRKSVATKYLEQTQNIVEQSQLVVAIKVDGAYIVLPGNMTASVSLYLKEGEHVYFSLDAIPGLLTAPRTGPLQFCLRLLKTNIVANDVPSDVPFVFQTTYTASVSEHEVTTKSVVEFLVEELHKAETVFGLNGIYMMSSGGTPWPLDMDIEKDQRMQYFASSTNLGGSFVKDKKKYCVSVKPTASP